MDRSSIPPGAEADEVIETIQSLQDRVDDLEAEKDTLLEFVREYQAGYEQQADQISALEAEVDQLREDLVSERRRRAEATKNLRETIDDLQDVIEDEDVDLDGKTRLEKYAAMQRDVREDTLGPSDRRAVALYENWFDVAEQTRKGYVVSTSRNPHKKHSPSDLKPTLSKLVDEDLAWTEVYRAMKALAKLSGGEHEVDAHDREHVVGGAFEYHETPTPDAKQVRKRLVCKDESILEEVDR